MHSFHCARGPQMCVGTCGELQSTGPTFLLLQEPGPVPHLGTHDKAHLSHSDPLGSTGLGSSCDWQNNGKATP